MTAAGAYFDLLDLLDSREILDPPAFLSLIQHAYGTGPVTYFEGAVIDGRLHARSLHLSHRPNANAFRRSLHRKAAVEQILRVLVALEPIAFPAGRRAETTISILSVIPCQDGTAACLWTSAPPPVRSARGGGPMIATF